MSKALVIRGADFSDNALDVISFDVIHAESVSLSQNSLSFTAVGGTATLTCTVLPEDAEDPIQWLTSNANVATVTGGVVTVVGVGSCTITCKAGSVSAACSVSVSVELEMNRYIRSRLSAGSSSNRMTTMETVYGTGNASYAGNLVLCGSEDTYNNLILTYGYSKLDSDTNQYVLKQPSELTGGDLRVYNYMKYPIPVVLPPNCTKVRCVAPDAHYGAYPLFFIHDTPAYENGADTVNKSHFSPYRDLQETDGSYSFVYQQSTDFTVPTGYDSFAMVFKTEEGYTKPSEMTEQQLAGFKVICL